MSDNNPVLHQHRLDVAKLNPVIRGLNDLVKSPYLSDAALAVIADMIQFCEQRRNLLHARIQTILDDNAAAHALTKDGYPNFDPMQIDMTLLAEIKRENDDLLVAISVFVPVDPRRPVSLGVDTVNVTDVQQPRPQH